MLGQVLLTEHSLRDCTVGVNHFILGVELLQTIEVDLVATLLFLSIIRSRSIKEGSSFLIVKCLIASNRPVLSHRREFN